MKLNKTILVLFLLLFIVAAIPVQAQKQTSFIVLHDSEKDFSAQFEIRPEIYCTIARQNVDGPYYDGPLGYNVIKIRKDKVTGPCCMPEDVMTLLVKGQYRLFGFSPDTSRVFAYRLKQYGAVFLIEKIIVFSRNYSRGKPIGPSGYYKYGAPTPDGRLCLLVDNEITIVDLVSGKSRKVQVNPPLGSETADQWNPPPSQIGGGVNLTGRYMEILWTTPRSGKLVVKGNDGSMKREVEISIDKN